MIQFCIFANFILFMALHMCEIQLLYEMYHSLPVTAKDYFLILYQQPITFEYLQAYSYSLVVFSPKWTGLILLSYCSKLRLTLLAISTLLYIIAPSE